MVGLACLAATAGRVYALGEGPFLNTDVGVSFITGLPSDVSADPGIRFSLTPGYRIYNDDLFSVSLQFDTGLVWNSIHNSARGDLYQVPFLAGIEFGFHTGSIVEPYIGVAGGGVYSDFNMYSRFEGSENSVNGAAQAMAGIRFKLGDHMEIGAGYKFLATWPANVEYLGTHSASVTFVVRF
jgi:opacity protein-like surface antigen